MAAFGAATGRTRQFDLPLGESVSSLAASDDDINALSVAERRMYVAGSFEGHLAAFALAKP